MLVAASSPAMPSRLLGLRQGIYIVVPVPFVCALVIVARADFPGLK